MRTLYLLIVCLVLGPGAWGGEKSGGAMRLTVEEALELAFPECEVERTTVYLTEAQRKRARKLAGFDPGKGIVRPYVATRAGKTVGTAYFDTHKVRTKRETIMFVVNPDGRIGRFELLAFAEPPEYIPRDKWYAQFVGKKLDDKLDLKRGIKGVTGATMTARATTRAARRTLAFHAVVFGASATTP